MLEDHRAKISAIVIASACGFFLAGCGIDDVQLNGKIFDAVGLGDGARTKAKEPKLVERTPIVMPPNVAQLPEPGANPDRDFATGSISEIKDHDEVRKQDQADFERQQAVYCKKNYEDAKVHGDNNADLAAGPLGPCRGSVLSAVKKINGSGEPETQEGQ